MSAARHFKSFGTLKGKKMALLRIGVLLKQENQAPKMLAKN